MALLATSIADYSTLWKCQRPSRAARHVGVMRERCRWDFELVSLYQSLAENAWLSVIVWTLRGESWPTSSERARETNEQLLELAEDP